METMKDRENSDIHIYSNGSFRVSLMTDFLECFGYIGVLLFSLSILKIAVFSLDQSVTFKMQNLQQIIRIHLLV